MPKAKKTTSKDVPGKGAARKAAKQIEGSTGPRKTRKARLDSIMEQIRKQQSTDSHQ